MPWLFWTLIGNVVVLVTSPLKKSPAATTELLTIKLSAFSAVPKNLKLLRPSESVSLLITLNPGLINGNPAIVAFGINDTSDPEIIPTTTPLTSTFKTVYETLSCPTI